MNVVMTPETKTKMQIERIKSADLARSEYAAAIRAEEEAQKWFQHECKCIAAAVASLARMKASEPGMIKATYDSTEWDNQLTKCALALKDAMVVRMAAEKFLMDTLELA